MARCCRIRHAHIIEDKVVTPWEKDIQELVCWPMKEGNWADLNHEIGFGYICEKKSFLSKCDLSWCQEDMVLFK